MSPTVCAIVPRIIPNYPYGWGDTGLLTLDIFVETEIDLDIQLCQVQLPLLNRFLVNSKALDLVWL